LDEVVLSLYDQYNDGWGYFDGSQSILTINGVDYTITAGTESFDLCIDLTACTDGVPNYENRLFEWKLYS
jgi:hypothetical protein